MTINYLIALRAVLEIKSLEVVGVWGRRGWVGVRGTGGV